MNRYNKNEHDSPSLYLFQSLPVEVPLKQFREWDKWISRFIWRGWRPRIKFKTLQLSKEKGGRALPCLFDYYKAAQLRSLVCSCNPDYTAKWKDLEISQLTIPLAITIRQQNFVLIVF